MANTLGVFWLEEDLYEIQLNWNAFYSKAW